MNTYTDKLREEWNNHYIYTPNEELVSEKAIADWWISHFSLILEELRNELICNQAVHASQCSNIMVIPQSAVEKLLGTPTEDASLAAERVRGVMK